MTFDFKRIADPVHGTVGLSELEIDCMSTQAFQRLRNIKQLGLAHLVFPGADYSRLSHSIGVCHVTGQILGSLNSQFPKKDIGDEIQLYRLAGLLHDVGHFPFSHAFEHAVARYYDERLVGVSYRDADDDPEPNDESLGLQTKPLSHEDVGQLLLVKDADFSAIFDKYGVSAERVYSIFNRVSPPRFSNLISSDLDADRIDYLLRTARHTGLPYGTIDIDYLLRQLTLDDKGRICLKPKALRTAEHFLLGRFFDYRRVSYNTSVVAFEEVLKDIVYHLLDIGEIDCSKQGIMGMIEAGTWHRFDDFELTNLIRHLADSTHDEVVATKVDSLQHGVAPKLIGSIEFIDKRHDSNRYDSSKHDQNVRKLDRIADELAQRFSIHRDLWYVWETSGTFTKTPSVTPVSAAPVHDDDIEQSIRILQDPKSRPIFDVRKSLMNILAQKALYSVRLYVILEEDRVDERKRITDIARCLVDDRDWVDGE